MNKIFNFQFSIFNKLKILLRKPKVVVVVGESRKAAKEAIFQVLNRYFKVGENVFVFEVSSEKIDKFKFFIKNSSLPVLVVTNIGDIPPDKDFFAGSREKSSKIRELAKLIPAQGYLVLNFDDETAREIKTESTAHPLTFGFQEKADFWVSDIKLNSGTNFKVNYKGNIVPIWLEKLFGKEQIYAALAGIGVGVIFDLNLVEISQTLKNYQGLPGKMKLIKGIKNSWILDDSESATVFSMIEAIEILGKIQNFNRKIAVLGDILGIGKYTIEAHEAIGERVAKNADLLFTFGPRAKFVAKGAQTKGMALEKIFQFDTIDEGKLNLQDEIKEGDLILVDGSKEMEMGKVVKEVKAM
jgi:UDP-N-acetylmuramoyl-tripeptide--D-alanyl-D-alanine ligase